MTFFIKAYSALIALILFIGKEVKAKDYPANVITGSKFSTFCDGPISGVNLRSPIQEVSLFLNNTEIYSIKPNNGSEKQHESVNSWSFSMTWLPDQAQHTNFNLSITVNSVKKKDQGRLECQVRGANKKLLKYIFVYDDGYDFLCPTKWYIYPIHDKCILLFTNKHQTWTNANSHCKNKHQGQLVVIQDQDFEGFLNSVLEDTVDDAWIGLSDEKEEAAFRWIGGEPAAYTNWQTTPQRDPLKNCVEKNVKFPEGPWQVEDCNKTLPFVCEKKTSDAKQAFPFLHKILIASGVAGGLFLIGFLALCVSPRCGGSKGNDAEDSASPGPKSAASSGRTKSDRKSSGPSAPSGTASGTDEEDNEDDNEEDESDESY